MAFGGSAQFSEWKKDGAAHKERGVLTRNRRVLLQLVISRRTHETMTEGVVVNRRRGVCKMGRKVVVGRK